MNEANGSMDRITMALGMALLTATTLTGCLGFVGAGGDYGGEVVVREPDVYLFGGGYERGREEHDYGRRGSESRVVVHPEVRAEARHESRPAAHPESRPSRPAAGGHEEKR
jgi:hypothetical protein